MPSRKEILLKIEENTLRPCAFALKSGLNAKFNLSNTSVAWLVRFDSRSGVGVERFFVCFAEHGRRQQN